MTLKQRTHRDVVCGIIEPTVQQSGEDTTSKDINIKVSPFSLASDGHIKVSPFSLASDGNSLILEGFDQLSKTGTNDSSISICKKNYAHPA
eukprot:scaffold3380_cov106-Cylindrotheca_fusiformis.AAC.9